MQCKDSIDSWRVQDAFLPHPEPTGAPFFAWLASGGLRWADGAATLGPGDLQLVEICALLAALVWWRHHQNIRRLIKGEEPKIGRSNA